MGHTLNSTESTFVEIVTESGKRSRIMSHRPYREIVHGFVKPGDSAYLVTTRTTWRGKNGKRTTEELSRTPMTP